MNLRRVVGCLFTCSLLPVSVAETSHADLLFVHDAAEQTLSAAVLENPRFYDAAITSGANGVWAAWLEFQPDKGDDLWIGQRGKDGWIRQQRLTDEPRQLANPTPTIDARQRLWITYESGSAEGWDVFARYQRPDGTLSAPQRVSDAKGPDINHRVAADRDGGLWIAWQSDRGGQFEIVARQITTEGLSELFVVSDSPWGDWRPALTVTPDGHVHVVWDSYDGENYNVRLRSLRGKKPGPILTLAGNPVLEARAQIVSDKTGRIWALWEEGERNWGKPYSSNWYTRKKADPDTMGERRMGDTHGPLHRFRELKLVELTPDAAAIARWIEIPQPALALAEARVTARADVKRLGAFYERGELAIDGQGRLWVAYRHYYAPWLGTVPNHHVQESFALYARAYAEGGWSPLVRLTPGQGDGTQRMVLAPHGNGVAAVWSIGYPQRRLSGFDSPRGVAFATADASVLAAGILPGSKPQQLARARKSAAKPGRPSTAHGKKRFELFFGDVHRHTDLSLCFFPTDGSLEDAYRYAIDAAPLDFFGVTDHTHDLAGGEPLSLLWWRTRKEADRHQLGGAFVPFYSYERSRGDTDHNVISLRPDMMRPHTYPLPQFWAELDDDTITIPHEPFNRALWNSKSDANRPVLEMYQGFRDTSAEDDAKEGLLGGHHIGFIASSDHLSTGMSFAGVWAEQPTRESIFRAIQARRTYGATAQIVLKVTCGDYWMGEKFSAKETPAIRIEAQGAAMITRIDVFVNGDLQKSVPHQGRKVNLSHRPELAGEGEQIVYVRLQQADGHRAWSSPMWINLAPGR